MFKEFNKFLVTWKLQMANATNSVYHLEGGENDHKFLTYRTLSAATYEKPKDIKVYKFP